MADLHEARRVRSTWARLIHKVYEVDPLECPRGKGPMRVIALIDGQSSAKSSVTWVCGRRNVRREGDQGRPILIPPRNSSPS